MAGRWPIGWLKLVVETYPLCKVSDLAVNMLQQCVMACATSQSVSSQCAALRTIGPTVAELSSFHKIVHV